MPMRKGYLSISSHSGGFCAVRFLGLDRPFTGQGKPLVLEQE
jgi:hypothetical protein